MIFDTHAHYDDEQFDMDRRELLLSMGSEGVGTIVNVSASYDSCEKVTAMAREYPFLYAAVGIHPDEVGTLNEESFARMRKLFRQDKVVAVGEIGLDYYYDAHPRSRQMEAMDRQWTLARRLGKPVIFHVREAWGDFLPWLRSHPGDGVMHCFTGSRESARECLDAGLMIAFGGAVTFKNANKLLEAAAYVPEDRLLLETDCPYLSPVPYRGKRNEPARVALVAECLAKLRGIAAEALAEACFANACQVFGWEEDE